MAIQSQQSIGSDFCFGKLTDSSQKTSSDSSPNSIFGDNVASDNLLGTPKMKQTKETKAHDAYIDEKMSEYDATHPAPKFNPVAMGLNANKDYDNWQQQRNEYKQNLEQEYQANNPEYKSQVKDYQQEEQRHMLDC